MTGVGWEAHVTSRDPTLDAVGTRSCAIRRVSFSFYLAAGVGADEESSFVSDASCAH